MTRIETVKEWRHVRIGGDGLPERTARRLHALSERMTRRLRVPQPVLTWTARSSLRAGQVVGVLSVPGASLEILPKIGVMKDGDVRLALTHMLCVARRLPIADSGSARLMTQRKDLLEVFIRLFTDRLLIAVRRGLPRRYRRTEDDLPLLRGKLNVRRQVLKHVVREDRLACSFDELTVDTPLNRVLKAVIVRLVSASKSPASMRKLSELAGHFEAVTDSTDPMSEPVILDRTNSEFHRLHALARLFLAGEWQSTTAGREPGFALMFPMNELFEEFVGRSLRRALWPREVRLQHTGHYAIRSSHTNLFALRPDIVVDDNIVIDTKWKELRPHETTGGVHQPDIYQLLAYAHAYKARRVILLYPWHEGLPSPGVHWRWRIAGTSIPFDIATVDVGKPESVPTMLRNIVSYHGKKVSPSPRNSEGVR